MGSINETLEKIKPFYYLLLILVICSIFFALGRISAVQGGNSPIKITYPNSSETASVLGAVAQNKQSLAISNTESTEVIGSKSGKKYYFPWCGTVKRIKPENQIKFSSIEQAKASGFTPGGNCKGLK